MIITIFFCIRSSVIIYVGAGLYVDKRMDDSVFNPRPIANNSLIVSGSDGLRLYCVSNSSESGVGTNTASNGDILNIDYNENLWRVQNPDSRPGVLRLQTRIESKMPMLLTLSTQGIYTCTISDNNGNNLIFKVGLYPSGFNCK